VENRRTFLKRMLALSIAAPVGTTRVRLQAMAAPTPTSGQAHVALTRLSSRQLAGQRVIYSYSGLTVPDALLRAISLGEAAGVIFGGNNIANGTQIAAVIQQLRTAQQQSPIPSPLLLMTDQEGGLVRRLPGEPVLSEKEVGQAPDPVHAAGLAGTGAGQNLANVGMNVNLAPVLDVSRQAGDFLDQFQRSYSMNPETVSDCGQSFIRAHQMTGTVATAKHFPGLGSATASQNTDAGPVTLALPLATLRAVDEAPYAAAISAGVRLIMVSWAIYPALDGTYPAGLSPAVVQHELRGRLGFQGVTMTDALEAGALHAFGSDGQRAVRAVQAGMDLILCSASDASQGQAVTTAIANALDAGLVSASQCTAAVQRITSLRDSLPAGQFFPQTGHWLGHGFLAYWNAFGGLPVFGYPITEEFQGCNPEGWCGVMQYFERARFEWHPGAWPSRYDVLLGLLGGELAQQQGLLGTAPFRRLNADSNANTTFFPETGHRLSFGFRDYWNSHGGLAIFGYPISEEFTDPRTGLTVQYFERQRFEYHPNNPWPWQVEGGLLGKELLPAQH
jgi:beta-N-acetylhexosaminidase